MATTLIKVLNESTQSSIVEMFFFGLAFSPCSRTSSTVGAGAPRRAGSSSSNSIYSPRQIFSASFDGTGGETGPTATAFFDNGVSRSEGSPVKTGLYLHGHHYCWSVCLPMIGGWEGWRVLSHHL